LPKPLYILILFFIQVGVYSQTVDCKLLKHENLISYKDTLPFSGHCVEYFDNGNKKFEAWYKNGHIRTSKLYYENGHIRRQIRFDRKVGYYITEMMYWYENGKRRIVVRYKKSILHGKWYEFDKEGGIVKQGKYKHGKFIKGDKFNFEKYKLNLE